MAGPRTATAPHAPAPGACAVAAPGTLLQNGRTRRAAAARDARNPAVKEFRWPVRVYYEDTDAGGVVYHASYLRFMERARTEWLRSHGFDQGALRERLGVLFVVRRIEVDFRRPARLDDELTVSARLREVRPARLLLDQAVGREGEAPLCEARVEVACLDAASGRPRRIPEGVMAELDGAG